MDGKQSLESSLSPLLDPEAIQKTEYLGLQARTIVEGYMAGAHKSPFRGFAVEFSQHREYVPGDDTRHLDWKVLGRSDRYYIKQYEQETNFVAHLLLDGSESMRYGSGSVTKLDYAKVMAACLAYLILLQRDAAAVTVFDDKPREHLPRTDSLAKILTICAVLGAFNPTQPTAISETLDDLARKTRRRGIVILTSDCFDDEDKLIRGIQHLRFVGHEVIVFQVLDPHEMSFPFQGNVEFIGLEAQGRMLTRPSEIRKSYLDEFGAFLDRIRLGC
ncbi:MAG: DUF58 domain-containing protein, partial [Chthoniobacteraceae bacterium]